VGGGGGRPEAAAADVIVAPAEKCFTATITPVTIAKPATPGAATITMNCHPAPSASALSDDVSVGDMERVGECDSVPGRELVRDVESVHEVLCDWVTVFDGERSSVWEIVRRRLADAENERDADGDSDALCVSESVSCDSDTWIDSVCDGDTLCFVAVFASVLDCVADDVPLRDGDNVSLENVTRRD
jgi:hypothetical protein